MLTKQLPYH